MAIVPIPLNITGLFPLFAKRCLFKNLYIIFSKFSYCRSLLL